MSDVAKVLFTARDIRHRVRQLGRSITRDYEGRPLVLISVLKGGAMFLSDLCREIRLPLRMDFMSISQYDEGHRASGVVRIEKDLDQDIGGEDVLIVEDIIDTGLTLSYLIATLRSRGPRTIETCTLLDKSARRIAPLDIRYVGFECPDRFVIGYGLDFQELYRNLPYILAVENTSVLAEDPSAVSPFATTPDAPTPERTVGGPVAGPGGTH